MKKLNVNVMTEIAIFAAIGWLLDFIQGAASDLLPNLAMGGSIGIAMLAVFIISLRRGIVPGLMCGLIMGMLDMLDGCYAYTDIWYKAIFQLALDYGIGYGMCCLAGVFFKQVRTNNAPIFLVLACLVGMLGKFVCHYISGVLFWPSDDFGGPFIYSLIYNGSYMFPSFILCSIILVIVYKKNKSIVLGEE